MLLILAGPTITVVAVGVTFFLTDRSHWRKFLLIGGIGLTRYAGVATLATVSISPGESAISIRGFL